MYAVWTQKCYRVYTPVKSKAQIDYTIRAFFGALGMRDNLAVKVRYRLGSRNC